MNLPEVIIAVVGLCSAIVAINRQLIIQVLKQQAAREIAEREIRLAEREEHQRWINGMLTTQERISVVLDNHLSGIERSLAVLLDRSK